MTLTDIIRAHARARWCITRDEAVRLLTDLFSQAVVDPRNPYVDASFDGPEAAAVAWVGLVHGLTFVSLVPRLKPDDGESTLLPWHHGEVRFDQPGQMHPLQHASLALVPAGMSGVSHVRRHSDRVLVVADTESEREVLVGRWLRWRQGQG